MLWKRVSNGAGRVLTKPTIKEKMRERERLREREGGREGERERDTETLLVFSGGCQ